MLLFIKISARKPFLNRHQMILNRFKMFCGEICIEQEISIYIFYKEVYLMNVLIRKIDDIFEILTRSSELLVHFSEEK